MIKKIVITGALGHIGSHLLRTLPLRYPDAEFVLIDNMATQRYPALFNLGNFRYTFYDLDVCEDDISSHIANADVVVHLAALTDAAGSFDRKDMVERINYNATKVIGELCIASKAKLIYPSSTSVYGTQNEVVDEFCSAEELQPQSPYAETKLKEEDLLEELGAQGLDFVTCRFGTIFGTSAGMRFHTAVNKFCWQAALGQSLSVWSTAYEQKRPYLSLLDAGRAVEFIIDNQIFDRQAYNVLTLNATVKDIVDTIRIFAPDLEVEFVDSRIMNQLSYEVSTERFKGLGFDYCGSLKSSIGDTIQLLSNANNRVLK